MSAKRLPKYTLRAVDASIFTIIILLSCFSPSIEEWSIQICTVWHRIQSNSHSNENVELNYRLRLKMFSFYLIRLYGRLDNRKFMRYFSVFRMVREKKTIKISTKEKETRSVKRKPVVRSNSVEINLLFGLVLYMN